jgi:phosphate-selective porin
MLAFSAPSAHAAEKKDKKEKKKHQISLTLGPVTVEPAVRIETETRAAAPDVGLDGTQTNWGDRRIGVQGTAFDKKVSFEVSRELKEDFEAANGLSTKSGWRDVYVGGRLVKGLNVRTGKFKLPFGREELIGEPNLDFVYRSLAARVLSPGRDTGVMAHGHVLARRLEYQVGYFTRDGENARTSQTEGGRDAFAGRFVVAPFAARASDPLGALEIGVDLVESRLDRRLGIRGRTVLGDGIFFDRVFVNGARRRVGFDGAWTYGPLGLSAEVVAVSDERRQMGFGGSDLSRAGARAWYVAGTWALTGEAKQGRLQPRHDFLRGGFGALEFAARVEQLRFDTIDYPGSGFGFPAAGDLLANADRVLTVGMNWYLNRYVKIQTDVVHEAIRDAQRSPAPSKGGRFTSAVLLLQFRI